MRFLKFMRIAFKNKPGLTDENISSYFYVWHYKLKFGTLILIKKVRN